MEIINNMQLNELAHKEMETSPQFRKLVCENSFVHFITTYLKHKFFLEPAPFQGYILNEIVNCKDIIGIIGFRGCAKTTIVEAYTLWCFLYEKSPLTVIICADKDASGRLVANIKSEIENNPILKTDFDIPVVKDIEKILSEKWSEGQLVLGNASIIAKSRGDKIRGINFRNQRPTLIIGDDIENTASTKTIENRKKTKEWFYSEVLPSTAQGILSTDTKIILIGNLVHKDCILANLKDKQIDNNNIVKVLEIPLLRENGDCNWKSLYPDTASIEKAKQKVLLSGEGLGNVIWAREYLLKSISEDEQIIKDEDIQHYPDDWLLRKKFNSAVGVDLAISEKQTADNTVFVKAFEVENDFGERRILIAKNNFIGKIDFMATIQMAKNISAEMPPATKFYIEDVAYQKAAIQVMQRNGIITHSSRPIGDKRARLLAISPYIKSGKVLFPKDGCKDILQNLIGFGIEAHDDAVDALVYVIDGLLNKPTVGWA